MAQKVYLSFLWHMHQPYYKDDIEQKTYMPWVFLHAIKDYYDIPYLSAKYAIKTTFNLVPSLLVQLQDYVKKSDNDIVLSYIQKEHNEIQEIEVLERFLFASHEQNMIKPLPRYFELFTKFKSDDNALRFFTPQELLDTKVLFLLSWCGNFIKQQSFIKTLIKQNREFSLKQLHELVEYLRDFIAQIIPFYKTLLQQKKIKLSTTPFFHPITPLLLDKKVAKEANPATTLPKTNTKLSSLASMQLQKGLEYFKSCFKQDAHIMWPAEGGISQEALKIFKDSGIKAIGSDEEILFHSQKGAELYNTYSYDGVQIAFRDKRLSDMIGFEFSTLSADDAVKKFMHYLQSIESQTASVNVILDGENAWEYYTNNAADFFQKLYKALNESKMVEVIYLDESLQEPQKLQTLCAGSWINANFDIWIGHCEKNRAWELIDRAYELFLEHKQHLDKEIEQKIYNEFLIATGSDWFWWYGEDHYTFFKDEFDRLFRKHLINIYTLLNFQIPSELFEPIHSDFTKQFITQPQSFITIERSSYFEWIGCGEIDCSARLSTMHTSSWVQKVYFGYDRYNIYFQFLFNAKKDINISIILDEKEYSFKPKELIKVPLPNKKSVKVAFVFEKEGKTERFPVDGTIELEIKDFSMNWFV